MENDSAGMLEKVMCQKCGKENELRIEPEACAECGEKLSLIQVRSSVAALLLAAAIGFGGNATYRKVASEERYPLLVEYTIVEQCANSSGAFVPHNVAKQKITLCANALRATQKDVDFQTFQEKPGVFATRFEKAVRNAK